MDMDGYTDLYLIYILSKNSGKTITFIFLFIRSIIIPYIHRVSVLLYETNWPVAPIDAGLDVYSFGK
jgi:hypothetical protein